MADEGVIIIPLAEDFRPGMAGTKCKCGRFLSNVLPTVAVVGEGYASGERIYDVRGDCSRCGPGVQAQLGWAWQWDAWFQ